MLDVINATYEKATQIAGDMFEISESIRSELFLHRLCNEVVVVYSDEPEDIEAAWNKRLEFIPACQERLSVLIQKLRYELREIQSLFKQIEDPYIKLATRNIIQQELRLMQRGLEPDFFKIGTPAISGTTINCPMLSVGLRILGWASDVVHYLDGLDLSSSLSGEESNIRKLNDDCPYSRDDHCQLKERIRSERCTVLKVWRSLNEEQQEAEDDIENEELLRSFLDFLHKKGFSNLEEEVR